MGVWLSNITGEDGEDRRGLEDNVYTVRDSEVVAKDCYHVAMVSDSTHWSVAPVPALASGFPV